MTLEVSRKFILRDCEIQSEKTKQQKKLRTSFQLESSERQQWELLLKTLNPQGANLGGFLFYDLHHIAITLKLFTL